MKCLYYQFTKYGNHDINENVFNVQRLGDEAIRQETWGETLRGRVGLKVREMQRESHEGNEREREVRRGRLREGVQKRQKNIERDDLFFDISFWRTEKIIASGYCLSDVSMCIATHVAKPLTLLELDVLSKTSLAGPLLVATIAHVSNILGSHNL